MTVAWPQTVADILKEHVHCQFSFSLASYDINVSLLRERFKDLALSEEGSISNTESFREELWPLEKNLMRGVISCSVAFHTDLPGCLAVDPHDDPDRSPSIVTRFRLYLVGEIDVRRISIGARELNVENGGRDVRGKVVCYKLNLH